MSRNPHPPCAIVPPHLLRRLAEQGDPAALRTLERDAALRAARSARAYVDRPVSGVRPTAEPGPGPDWVVHTAGGSTDLPGEPVRTAGEPSSGDETVDEAAAGITATLALMAEVYDRDSYDGRGRTVSATVHYGEDYDNAFWDGTQLVFGDGDGEIFGRFTRSVDVLAHELVHALTEHTASLVYEGQSGALNESVSDVFGSCVRQRLLGQQADAGDWLIGAEIFRPGVQARALRDMAAPGTAYDDPRLGQDPQVGHLDDFVETTDDNGGVHLNSGIPNRAFHLAATRIGGTSWDGAGRIWWQVLTGGELAPDADFLAFARATVAAAGDHADVVRQAWRDVGVRPGPGVRVRRSGGFIGRAVESQVDLDELAEREDERARELRDLVGRVGSGAGTPVQQTRPYPDGFTYEFDVDGSTSRVFEADLTPDLRRIADLVLRPGGEP